MGILGDFNDLSIVVSFQKRVDQNLRSLRQAQRKGRRSEAKSLKHFYRKIKILLSISTWLLGNLIQIISESLSLGKRPSSK